ncbi:LysE family translocator [Spongiactinospora sp. 9N601]|uniref:LysE family translocator n=1 Tax=Spongiactinospora sp. 9N601 TaxID=3375149 RepID=UPI0037B51CE7
MAMESLLAFWGVALLLIAVPGADWAFTVQAGLRGRAVPAVAGLATGYAAVTVLVAAGVGVLVAATPALLTALTVIGGAYLIWHGATTLLHPTAPAKPYHTGRRPAAPAETVGGLGAGRRVFVRGVGVSALNPKGLLIFVALLPQFTDPGAGWPVGAQIGALGLAFVLTCAAFYLLVGQVTHALFAGRPAAARLVARLSGAAMVALGGLLLAGRLL